MTYTNLIHEDDDDWGSLTDPKTTDVTPVTTSPTSSSDNTSSSAPSLGFGGKAVRDAALNLVRDPKFLIPAGAAALGAGALFRTGQRIANVGSDEKKQRGPISRAFRTIVPLGLAAGAAYGAHKFLKKESVQESAPDFFNPKNLGVAAGSMAGGLASFPLADALTAGIKNPALKTAANIGAKAILSTGLTAAGGFFGYKGGKAVEDAQEKAREREMERLRKSQQNSFLPKFYYDD